MPGEPRPHGALIVNGTSGNDVITVSLDTRKGMLNVSVDGKSSHFKTAKVRKISVNGGAGNDRVSVALNISTSRDLKPRPATIPHRRRGG